MPLSDLIRQQKGSVPLSSLLISWLWFVVDDEYRLIDVSVFDFIESVTKVVGPRLK